VVAINFKDKPLKMISFDSLPNDHCQKSNKTSEVDLHEINTLGIEEKKRPK
jgi:hypothetical protein